MWPNTSFTALYAAATPHASFGLLTHITPEGKASIQFFFPNALSSEVDSVPMFSLSSKNTLSNGMCIDLAVYIPRNPCRVMLHIALTQLVSASKWFRYE